MTLNCPLCQEAFHNTEVIDHLVDGHSVAANMIWFIPTGNFNDRGQLEVAVELVTAKSHG